ncbi:MAG: hypothetical protein MUE81_03635, partial [Thermoflexibacter sp.]|nr:hypothetical protein [Thermoflexibacter sp.]
MSLVFSLWAQEDQLKNLKETLSRVKTERSEMNLSNELAMTYLANNEPDSAIRYAMRALDLSHIFISNEDEF